MPTAEDIRVKITADGAKAERELRKVKQSAGGLTKGIKNLALAAASTIGAVAAFKKLTAFLGNASEAAAVQEAAVVRLGAALDATGQSGNGALGEMQAYASALQEVTVVGDETSLALMQTAVNMGLSSEEAQEATKTAIALSRAYGIDLNTAMIGVVNTMQGQTSTLTRYIPSLKAATDETERMAILNDEATKAWEVATKEVDSATGAYEQLQNAIGDTTELTGLWVNETLTPLRTTLTGIITELNNYHTAQINLNKALAGDEAANYSAALDDQREKVAALKSGIAAGGREASKLAREYEVHINKLDEILSRESGQLAMLERIISGRTQETQERNNSADAAERELAADEESARLAEERAKLVASAEAALAENSARSAELFAEQEQKRLQALADRINAEFAAEQEAHLKKLQLIEEEKTAREQANNFAINQARDMFSNFSDLFDKNTAEGKAAARTMAVFQRGTALYNAFISTEEAATKALTAGPFAGPIMSGIIRGLGYANMALMAAKPLPFATGTPPGGYMVPPGYEDDSYPVRAKTGERVHVDRNGDDAGLPAIFQFIMNDDVLGEVNTRLIRNRKTIIRMEDVA